MHKRIPTTLVQWFSVWVISMGFSCTSSYQIVEKPIIWNQEREALTLEYIEERYGLQAAAPSIVPRMIVLHWTAIPTLSASFEAFEAPRLRGRTDIQGAGALNVSAHFLVDRDGTIYRLMPETTMARHVIGLNHSAIGIENVGGTVETPLNKAQLKSNIWLVSQLSETYGIEYLIGHYEYTAFEGHPLWLEKDARYRTEKTDPGTDFMKKVRKKTKKYQFKKVPLKQ